MRSMEKQTLRQKVQLNEVKKKRLMKRLHQIKLNKSRNHSFWDTYYEAKLRKLRNNNISLAKSLAEQRQISNQWFEECLLAKADIHDREQKLLRYQIIEDGHFERAVEVEMEKRLKTLSEPIESSINLSLDTCLNLCKHLSKTKQLFHSLVRGNENGRNLRLSSYSRNGRRSVGSRPPLCKNGTPKSPRKNVVHPMVEGHVIGPAQICLPRVSLEDRYRYRLQERAERFEEQGNNMTAISEQSIVLNEEPSFLESVVNSPEVCRLEPSNESQGILSNSDGTLTANSPSLVVQNDQSSTETAREQSPIEETFPISPPCLHISKSNADSSIGIENYLDNSPTYQNTPELTKNKEATLDVVRLNSVENCLVTTSPYLKVSLDFIDCLQDNTPKRKKSSRLYKNEKRNIKGSLENDDANEDPLEGPSWMHLKKKRGRKCRNRQQASLSPLQPLGTVRLVLENSSDEDVDIDDGARKKKILPFRPSNLCLPSSKREPPILHEQSPLYKHEDLERRIGRRSKKKSRVKDTGGSIDDKLSNVRPLDSFIINETLICESDSKILNDGHNPCSENSVEIKFVKPNTPPLISVPLVSVNNTNNPYLVHEKENLRLCNVTCFLNSSMEMTECLSKDLITVIDQIPKVNELVDMDVTNCGKPKKFFKSSENDNFEDVKSILAEKTPFDSSLIEPSFHIKPSSILVKKCGYSSPSPTVTKELNEHTANSLQVDMLEQNVHNNESFTSVTKGKENVPPIIPEASLHNESGLKLRSVAIVVEDILKSPVGEESYVVQRNSDRSEGCKRGKSFYCPRKSDSASIVTRKLGKRSSRSLNGKKKLTACSVKSECFTSVKETELDLDPLQEEKCGLKRNTRRKMVVIPLIDNNFSAAKPIQESPIKKSKPKSKCFSRIKMQKKLNGFENLENTGDSMDIDPLTFNVNGKLNIADVNYVVDAKCEDKRYLRMAPSSVYLRSLVSNSLENNFTSSCPSGFEGFPIHEKKLLTSAELPRLLANRIGAIGYEIPQILGDEIMNADNDRIIYIEPLMVDLEEEIGDGEKSLEHDPLSAVQLPLPCASKVLKNRKLINGLDKPCFDGVESDCLAFDTHTASLIGEYLPLRRRAASQITSFKEPSLHKKLRNENETKRKNKSRRGTCRGSKL